MTDQAFATLTTNDAYTKAVLHRTTKRLVVLATPQVSDSMRKVLETVFAEVIMVDVLDELAITLTKLHCWLLIQYSKCVSMDADTLVLGNIDDLFEREEISAGPDPRWPDYFNSEVFIYQPSQGSFDGGDQGLLNTFFFVFSLLFFLRLNIRKHLPFIYNLSSISIYSHLPAFKVFGVSAKVVKPWNYIYDPQTKSVKSDPEFLILWWNIFTNNVLPLLQQFGLVKDTCSHVNMEDVSGAMSHLSLGEIPAMTQPFVSSEEWKECWEQGQADYMGADSFDNIKRKLDTYLQ
uniref:glycogenin glucosyltransferase n=1 Tax=Cercocebus atys TaxID=9531 RepID=A0A2K5LXL4_CERAT